MKPTVDYKLKKESKWLTASAVCMGLAFFLQAFDFLGLRLMQGISTLDLIVYMIFPMVSETVWCVYVRTTKQYSAKIGGIMGAVMCLVVLVQTLFCGNLFLLIIGILSCLLAAVTLVLITWGFIAHRHLGFLVLAAISAVRILLFGAIGFIIDLNWSGILREIPMVCVLLSLMLFFGGIYPMRKE